MKEIVNILQNVLTNLNLETEIAAEIRKKLIHLVKVLRGLNFVTNLNVESHLGRS